MVIGRSGKRFESSQVEVAPPDAKRRPNIADQAIRRRGRIPAAALCRDEALAALWALAERSGRQARLA
jgi:hypothetical protein